MAQKITSYQTAEFGKFEEIIGSSEYPPVSVTRISYPDTTNAFPSNSAVEPLSSIEIYPKYAVLTKLINPEDIKVSLSAQNINMNLDEIELNTDEIESLITSSNTLLSSLTSITQTEFDQTQTLLEALTSLQNSKQEEVITLLNQLTANTDNVEPLIQNSNALLESLTAVDYATSNKQDVSNNLLNALTASNVNVPGFSIPPYDEITFNYVESTDIFRTVTYLKNSTQVMSLSFTYVTEPPTTGNAIIQSVKKV